MKWLDLSAEERDAAINTVAEQLNIDTPSVEKDWWVTAVLHALFQTSFAPYLTTAIKNHLSHVLSFHYCTKLLLTLTKKHAVLLIPFRQNALSLKRHSCSMRNFKKQNLVQDA